MRPADEGSVSVLAAGIITAVAGVACLLIGLGASVVHRHEAAVAAELAAVAGAREFVLTGDGCPRVEEIAAANKARLVSCVPMGEDLQVRVAVSGREAAARAGPM